MTENMLAKPESKPDYIIKQNTRILRLSEYRAFREQLNPVYQILPMSLSIPVCDGLNYGHSSSTRNGIGHPGDVSNYQHRRKRNAYGENGPFTLHLPVVVPLRC